jgi:DNA replication protein DnaC
MVDSTSKTIGQALATTGLFKNTKMMTCEVHGEYKAYEMPGGGALSRCRKCLDQEDAERRRLEHEERLRAAEEANQKALVRDACIPPRFAGRTLDNFVAHNDGAKRALTVARSYVEDFEALSAEGTSLIFCGGVGTGKTHLAVGIANAVLAMKLRVRFASVMTAVRTVKETYSKGSDDTERDALNEFIYPRLLVLDEVGAQFGSDTEKLILFEIINGRYEQMKPTVVISNLAKEALGEFIGERSIDRLRENGGRLVAFDWASYRRQAA